MACGDNARPAAPKDAPAIDAAPDAAVLPRCANPVAGTKVTMREITRVTGAALLVTAPPNDPRLFILEQQGRIRIFKDGALLPAPFLDLSAASSGPVVAGGEQGLLGLAFHPAYPRDPRFFVYYTTVAGSPTLRDVVARCTVSADPDRAEPTCTEILSIPDFAANHNGGMLEFGSDGLLYIATGDGGNANDPYGNGQALVNGTPFPQTVALLGKILRIDIDRTSPGKQYAIPDDNPFAAGGGAPEIFIIGLRNPWRFSFDRDTNDLWIGDVGQNTIEELTVMRPAQQRGANLGWKMYEGNNCFIQPSQCSPAGKTFPQDARTHANSWGSIIAGQVYRGTCYPDLVGWHFYTDYRRGGLVRARLLPNNQLEIVDLTGTFPTTPASLHADARGELYETSTTGRVYHLEVAP